MLKPFIEKEVVLATSQPPSGGCVLKHSTYGLVYNALYQPPSGGCVLKPDKSLGLEGAAPSRLQAAVC